MIAEIWKDVVGFEGLYQISDKGTVRSVERVITRKNGHPNKVKSLLLKPRIGSTGYFMVTIYKNATPFNKRVHRLIAEAFIPNPEKLPNVNHLDGNKLNNSISNLEWCTHAENMTHAFQTGLTNNTGSNNGQSKLSESQVLEIKQHLQNGTFQHLIAEMYNVSRSAILSINLNRTWTHLSIK